MRVVDDITPSTAIASAPDIAKAVTARHSTSGVVERRR